MRVHHLVVDVHHGCLITRCQTFHTAQGEASIWGGFTGFDAQLVFEITQTTTCSIERARQVNADLEAIFSVRLSRKQRIKGSYALHVYHRHLEQIRHSLADIIIDIRKLTHCQVKCRQHHSAPGRVMFEKLVYSFLTSLGELHCHTCPRPCTYRSFSPAI